MFCICFRPVLCPFATCSVSICHLFLSIYFCSVLCLFFTFSAKRRLARYLLSVNSTRGLLILIDGINSFEMYDNIFRIDLLFLKQEQELIFIFLIFDVVCVVTLKNKLKQDEISNPSCRLIIK